MIPKKYTHYVRALFIVLPMSCIVTVMNTIIASGFDHILTGATLHRWLISAAIAYPSVLLVTPLAIRLTEMLSAKK